VDVTLSAVKRGNNHRPAHSLPGKKRSDLPVFARVGTVRKKKHEKNEKQRSHLVPVQDIKVEREHSDLPCQFHWNPVKIMRVEHTRSLITLKRLR
jgi:hypothetical protein